MIYYTINIINYMKKNQLNQEPLPTLAQAVAQMTAEAGASHHHGLILSE